MVKRALCVKTEIDKTIINKQWNNRRFKNNNHKNVIALVDISADMMDNDNIAIMSAIGIGLRISENNSIFKDCLLLYFFLLCGLLLFYKKNYFSGTWSLVPASPDPGKLSFLVCPITDPWRSIFSRDCT